MKSRWWIIGIGVLLALAACGGGKISPVFLEGSDGSYLPEAGAEEGRGQELDEGGRQDERGWLELSALDLVADGADAFAHDVSGLIGDGCDTNDDCLSGLCIVGPGGGVCTDYCSGAEFCDEGLCVDLGGASPVCAPSCAGWDDDCGPEGMGLSCIFGDLVSPPASGKYACALVTSGLGGTPCEDDLQCADGDCYRPEDEDGFCATLCGLGADCPFGAVCVQKDADFVCMRRCASNLNCGDGFTCTTTTYSAMSICTIDAELR